MTYNEAIYSIREGVRQYADDSSISNRFIEFELAIERAKFIPMKYKTKIIPDSYKQTLCFDLEETTNSECGCVDENCTLMRTTTKVPTFIGNLTVASGTKDSIPFSNVSWNRFTHSGNNAYNINTVFSSVHTDYRLYLKSKNNLYKLIECINIRGVFDNPSDAVSSSTCGDKATDRYPIEAADFAYVQEAVIKKLLLMLNIPEDLDNNANDDARAGKTK